MKHPEGSFRCDKCGTDAMVVDRNYICDCDIRTLARTAPDEANRLRQVLTLLRGHFAVCDRCRRERAFKLIACYQGHSHAQCFDCATQTKTEAAQERLITYRTDEEFLNSLGGQ